MPLNYPFYIRLNNSLIKVSEEKYLRLFENTHIENVDNQFWIVSDTPIDIHLMKDKNKITFGRLSKNDILLTNKQATRRHCDLIKHSYEWTVYDLNSKNGTFINGNPVNCMQDISEKTFNLQTGGNSWTVNINDMKVRTCNLHNLHKYPLFGGEVFNVDQRTIEVIQFDFGVSSHQGRRMTMEDQHAVIPSFNGKSIYMVFDGHGGGEASEFVKSKMGKYIEDMKDNEDINEYRDSVYGMLPD